MALARYVNQFEDQAEVIGALPLGQLWDRLRGEFLNEYARLERTGLTGEALERELVSFLDGLSDKPVQDLARKASSVAYNQGRDAEMRSMKATGQADYAVRSEVLDSATCDSCASLDGLVFEVGTADYQRAIPPAMCEGGDRCRGFMVLIPRGMEDV